MKKFTKIFLAFFVAALTSVNTVLPTHAEEESQPTLSQAGFSVSVIGDGTVTLSSGDFTKTLSDGETYSADYDEGTEIKITSRSNANSYIDDVSLNSNTIAGFTSGKKSFSFAYKTKTADANFSVVFKEKEAQKSENTGKSKAEAQSESQQTGSEDANDGESKEGTDQSDTSSDKTRLVVEGKKKEVSAEKGAVTAQFGKMYVLQYDSKSEATNAYEQLKSKGAKVDTEQVLSVDDDVETTDEVSTDVLDTAINKANDKTVKDYTGKDVIALIDTGTDGSTVDAVSFVDNDVTDNNGHARKMVKTIRKQNKNAKILALKALDDNGKGTTASVVAALQYAIDSHVSIINMSFSGKANDDTSLIEAKVKEAIKAGITVVASAGNNGSIAYDYIPANIDGVITAGACDSKGTILSTSNYGIIVDWYINADATSQAASTVTGILSKDGKITEDQKTVFSPKSVKYASFKTDSNKSDDFTTDDAGGSGGGSGSGGAYKNYSVDWVIYDDENSALGDASNLDTAKETIKNIIRNKIHTKYAEEDIKYWTTYVCTGTDAHIKKVLSNAVESCRQNYIKENGTAEGFKPRIVAVGICSVLYDGGLVAPNKVWKYDRTNGWADDSVWSSKWDAAAANASLQHHGTKYNANSNLFYAKDTNGSWGLRSLKYLGTNSLSGQDNIRIVVLDDSTPGPQKGKLSIMKKSANPEITDNNPCYELKGAEYGVYKTKADATNDKNKVNTLIIGKYDDTEKNKNWSNEIELEAGTYYVKETKAPKGYALNPNAVKVVIEAGKNTWIGEESNDFVDYPQADPVGILLGKVDKETNKNKPQGSASLEGAEFTVKYYKGLYDEDPATKKQTPARTWVLKTDKDGFTYLDSDYKVSGDDFYMFGNIATIPVGTITIQESKAPTGYFINNEVFVRKIEANGNDQYVSTYNQPKILEKVVKFDIKKVQVGTTTPVSGAVFRHTLPNGSTEDLTTNDSGEITITGLASGTHKIKEIKSPDGYQLNPNEVVFNVASGTGKITFTSGTNSLVTQGTKDSGDGYATFGDKVNPFNLKITKTNEHGKALKGAEFTLYSDEGCKNVVDTQISDEKGLLTFKNLDVEKTYYFKETKAPTGYRIPVDENGNAYVHSVYVSATPQTNTFDFTVDNVMYNTSNTTGNVRLEGTKNDRVVAVSITNKTTQLLPETGSNGTILLIGLGVAVIAFALYKSKKEKMNSK